MPSKILVVLSLMITIGCVTAPEHIDLDSAPASVQCDAGGQAEIVVVRPGIAGWAVSMGVWVNDEKMGDIRSNDYVHCSVPPGRVLVKVTSEAPCEARFPVEANRRYYVRAKAKAGWWYARVQLEMLEPEEGEEYRQDCEDQTHPEDAVPEA